MGERKHMESLKIQVPAGELNLYRELAKENDVSCASVIRALLAGRLEKYLGVVRYVDPEQAQEIIETVNQCCIELEKTRLELNRIGVNINQLARIAWTEDIPEYEKINGEVKCVKKIMNDYESIANEMSESLCHIRE